MKRLTQRALRVFAVLEDYRSGSADVLDALLPFLEPFIADHTGDVLQSAELAREISKAYHWNLTADIIDEFIPRFVAKGWVREVRSTDTAAIFEIAYEQSADPPEPQQGAAIDSILLDIGQEFKTFAEKLSPLVASSHTAEEFSEILVEWLVSIDAYTEDVLQAQILRSANVGGTLGFSVDLPDASSLSSEDRYLCARFTRQLFDTKSPHIPDLCKIASIGLLTEVVQDFRKPVGRVSKIDLNVYLDAPVALDLLGVSGAAAAANIRPIIDKLQACGAQIRIFRTSVEELQGALRAVLNRAPAQRTGPTADALRRNELHEAFARQVAANPDAALEQQGVRVVPRDLRQFPNEHRYFTDDQYRVLFSRINWHAEINPREHDTTVIALILRMRGGHQSADLFRTKHIFVTRNALLAQLSRRFCVDNGLNEPGMVGPAVHQRQIATAVWLRTGLSSGDEEVPRRYVLAACERVLELKKAVVDKVRAEARALTKEKAEQLELLLTQDRSTQVLMDKTLGVSQVVDRTNIETLVDTMKRSLTAEIERGAEEQLAAVRHSTDEKTREANERWREAEGRADGLERSLRERDADDLRIAESLVSRVNKRIRRRRWWMSGGVMAVALVIAFAQQLSGIIPVEWRTLASVVIAVAGATLCYFQIWDRSVGLTTWLERSDRKVLEEFARDASVGRAVQKFQIDYVGSKFRVVSGLEGQAFGGEESGPDQYGMLDRLGP